MDGRQFNLVGLVTTVVPRWDGVLYEPTTDTPTTGVVAMSEQQTQTGPITVNHPVPREQLIEEGVLVSFRKRDRTTGDTWWRESRTAPKRGDCTVEKLRAVVPKGRGKALGNFVTDSGFDSVDEWQDAIEELHGEMPEIGYLYRITERYRDE